MPDQYYAIYVPEKHMVLASNPNDLSSKSWVNIQDVDKYGFILHLVHGLNTGPKLIIQFSGDVYLVLVDVDAGKLDFWHSYQLSSIT